MTTYTDTARSAERQCSRARTTPTRVGLPLTGSALVVALTIVLAVLLGLPAPVAVAVVLAACVVLALLVRRTLGSLIAGAGMRLAQPFEAGDQIRVFVPSMNSVEDAEIVRVGAVDTTLLTESGTVLVPNAHMLRQPTH
ncbi:hypothetical protein [uncultured Jatrophihabitans sp.]|uniref:hypothetical protein n=1 Tax=uncultured Jatrophihabitans sp. TaxID=1610747 RepID=UPI0035C98389